jgi:V/A-type H+-transporting ATPase subunit D
MARLPLPATKANLLRVKEDLVLAQEGYQLLDEKREVILREIFSHLADLKRSRKEANAALAEAYAALREACFALGRDGVARAALAARLPGNITVQERSLIGVVIPLLEWEAEWAAPAWGLLETAQELDIAREKFLHALRGLIALAEIELAFHRLAAELRKTQKRVNALQMLLIPQYQETLHYLESSLEEKEREALFQLKRMRERQQGHAEKIVADS